jgi:hypothetical protein
MGSDFKEVYGRFFVLIVYGALFDASDAATTRESALFLCKCAANVAMMYLGLL